MTDHLLTLIDGRSLGYALFGNSGGYPVLYFHGTPSSRLEPLLLTAFGKNIDALLAQHRLQLISVDRPGMGNSSFHPEGNFRSFAEDLAALAGALNIKSSALFGWSGAGPYMLSMAWHYPQLVRSLFMVAAFTRGFHEGQVFRNMTANRYYFGAAKHFPAILRLALKIFGSKPVRHPMPRWLSRWPEPDHRLMKADEKRMLDLSRYTIAEALKNDARGVVHEARLYFDAPGYDLGQISQPLHYWWGTEDNVVQEIHAEAIRQQVPRPHLHIREGEGHFSIYIRHFEEMLQQIAQQVHSTPGDS